VRTGRNAGITLAHPTEIAAEAGTEWPQRMIIPLNSQTRLVLVGYRVVSSTGEDIDKQGQLFNLTEDQARDYERRRRAESQRAHLEGGLEEFREESRKSSSWTEGPGESPRSRRRQRARRRRTSRQSGSDSSDSSSDSSTDRRAKKFKDSAGREVVKDSSLTDFAPSPTPTRSPDYSKS
jgi:hypothetical protein